MGRPAVGRSALPWFGALLAALTACTTGGPAPVANPEVAQSTVARPAGNELVIGVGDLGPGFNPHTLADLGPVSLGVAGLVLPSAFREDDAGALRADTTLVVSAEVTSQQPFTVTYQLRREASWSDGAPIAAEDFAYLVERMKAEPGTANPAGYRLIQRVSAGSGGKRVDVVFDRPYPGWRTLFANLLPAHLLKDAPGGWPEALEGGIPVSGGPFAMRAVDDGRGMIVLERNDRYWEVPALLDRLVLRKADTSGLVTALATGGDQLAVLRADGIAMALLRAHAAGLPVRTVPEPLAAELLLRPSGSDLSDARVRAAVAAALDVPDLVAVGTGNGPAAQLTTAARTLLPTQPGYQPTGSVATAGLAGPAASSPGGGPAGVAALLVAAGFERFQLPDGRPRWARAGQALSLVVAAPAERADYVLVATRVVRQLAAAGIDARLATPTGDDLFAELTLPPDPAAEDDRAAAGGQAASLATSPMDVSIQPAEPGEASPALDQVDLAVVPRPVSGDPAADLVSWYGCPDLDGPVAGRGPSAVQTDLVPLENPVGYCNPALQAAMDDLLTGASPVGQALAPTEAEVWQDLPSIPLYQHAVVMVSGRGVVSVEPGSLFAGTFADASQWTRPSR